MSGWRWGILFFVIMRTSGFSAIIDGPFLQNVTQNSITIKWITDTNASGLVQFGTSTNYGNQCVSQVTRLMSENIWVHEAILTALKPGTVYHYQVSASGTTTTDYTFKIPGAGNQFSFAVYGDSQDAQYYGAHDDVARNIAQNAPDLVLHTGDLIGRSLSYANWQGEFFQMAAPYLPRIPLFTTIGNHEYLYEGVKYYQQLFSLPSNGDNEHNYYVDYLNARFIVLDSDLQYGVGGYQYQWLENLLKNANKDWVFVFFHRPLYSSSDPLKIDITARASLDPLLERYGVDIVFNGHTHNYERSQKGDVTHIITSGGGGELRPVNVSNNPYQVYAASVYHHCLIRINGTSLSLQAINLQNQVFDSFVRDKTPATSPVLSVSPTTLNFAANANNLSLSITNSGDGTLNWTAVENPDLPWITQIAPANGTLSAKQSTQLTVTVNRDGLTTGEYAGTIQVTSDGGTIDIPVSISVGSSAVFTRRINCGSTTDYTDPNGNVWEKDQPYSAGSWGYSAGDTYSTTHPIANTNAGALYQTVRWGDWLNYHFDLANGTYQVVLHFAEIYYSGTNQRVFHVMLEGTRVLSSFDIYKEVGHDVATSRTFQVNVTDGRLDLEMNAVVDAPNISAIEISGAASNPVLSVAPQNLDFGGDLTQLSFTITNSGGKNLNWAVAESSPIDWLTGLSPVSGNLASGSSTVITVTVNREGLTAGNYSGKIAVTSDGGNIEVTVNLSVAGTSVLSVSPAALDFGTSTNNLSLTITNFGGDSLKWNANENPDQSWLLAITPNSGVLLAQQSATVQVTVSRTGLTVQDYTTNIQMSSNGGEMVIPIKLTVPQPVDNIRRVSCGRTSSYTDQSGQIWESDRAYSTGGWGYVGGNSYTTSHATANTLDDPIYQSDRWGLQGYQFDLANGNYQVTLHFAEVYCTRSGQRIFSVEIENQRVLSNYDIYAEVGHDYAVQKSYSVTVTDNQLNIDLKTYLESPMISAIEILTLSSNPALAVTPTTLDFGTAQTQMSFTVTNSGGGALSWTAAASPEAPWITNISPANSTLGSGSSATITVQIDRSGLSDGNYTTQLAVSSNAGNQTVTVNMSVAQNPVLSVSSKTLDFGTTTTSLSLALTNSGAGTLTWSAVENPEVTWLTALNPASGSLAAKQTVNLVVTVDRTGLAAGSYSGKINVQSNGGNQEITVNLQVVSTINAVWRVNCGSSQNYTDGAGNVWESDQAYIQGSWGYVDGDIFSTRSAIGNTNDAPLFQSVRWGMRYYRFDLPNGAYEVTLDFAEIYCNQSNQRLFQVEIEGQVVLSNFDIYAEVGFARALQKVFNVNVTDGQLTLRFRTVVEDAMVSAIQVKRQSGNQMLAKSNTEPEVVTTTQLPTQFVLHQNYPNPFNPGTTIAFELPESQTVRLAIYNLMGQYVTELVNEELNAGSYQFEWTATDHRGDAVPNGIYFAVLQSGPEKKIIKMTCMK